MTLCEADITTKNPNKFKNTIVILKSSKKIVEVEERDQFVIFNPITRRNYGLFNLKPSKEIECSKSH
jgi:tRNA nucleotidyltransferase (CCA-adding enzyme)